MTPCYRIGPQDFICTGDYGIAPPGTHFGWDKDKYPVVTDDPGNVIECLDCGEPAITVDYWAWHLDMAYCANCADVHLDIDPVTRQRRRKGPGCGEEELQ